MKKQVLLLGLAAAFMISCGSSRQVATSTAPAGDVAVEIPCSEFAASADYFRATAMGVSTNLEIASQKAMTAARTKLASAIQVKVQSVTAKYISSHEEGMNSEDRGRYESLSKEAVSQTLGGVRVICQKTMQSPDGQYKCYVAVELSGNDIAAGIGEKISADSKLRTDFEYQKFQETFKEEMEKLANE